MLFISAATFAAGVNFAGCCLTCNAIVRADHLSENHEPKAERSSAIKTSTSEALRVNLGPADHSARKGNKRPTDSCELSPET